MNKERLQKIFDNYVERYDVINGPENHEIYKWAAASNFQKYWDVDAGNFGDMFKLAMDDAESLFDVHTQQPVNGVVFLCNQSPETMEAVRQAFRDLFAADGSVYSKRQRRMESFIKKMNTLLKKADPDKWKYHQDIFSTSVYLSMYDPDDNFIYSEPEAKEFAEFIEVKTDFVKESSVSLPKYYKMCQTVVAELQKQTELAQMVADALSIEADQLDDVSLTEIDDEYHILTYDLISCAANYNLYDKEGAVRKVKTADPVDEEKKKEKQRLRRKQRAMEKQLEEMKAQREKMEYPSLKRRKVVHAKFGKGTINNQEEQYLSVKFETVGVKKFLMPDALAKGFLTLTEEGPANTCREISEMDAAIEALERDIYLMDAQRVGLAKA